MVSKYKRCECGCGKFVRNRFRSMECYETWLTGRKNEDRVRGPGTKAQWDFHDQDVPREAARQPVFVKMSAP